MYNAIWPAWVVVLWRWRRIWTKWRTQVLGTSHEHLAKSRDFEDDDQDGLGKFGEELLRRVEEKVKRCKAEVVSGCQGKVNMKSGIDIRGGGVVIFHDNAEKY